MKDFSGYIVPFTPKKWTLPSFQTSASTGPVINFLLPGYAMHHCLIKGHVSQTFSTTCRPHVVLLN